MKNNRSRITAAVLLLVFVCTFFIAAGQRFLRPPSPVTPAGGNPITRLARDGRRETKGIFKRKNSKDKNDYIKPDTDPSTESKEELTVQANAETTDNKSKKKLNLQSGINREKLRKDSREKIRKNIADGSETIYKNSEKPHKDRVENGGSYNNRGGKCPDFNTPKGE